MNHIDKIVKDGFSLQDQERRLGSLALLSLKIALKAYFSTYHTVEYMLHILDPKNGVGQGTVDTYHPSNYYEAYAETIVHFQHFVELVFKDILRAEHPLLADDATLRPVILHKLLKGGIITAEDAEGLKSIEFTETLKRLCNLITNGQIGSGRLGFITEAQPWLEKLNSLRNRIWHRGTFILRYHALDEFVSRFILPFVDNVIALPQYSGLEPFWKYEELKCGVDPIQSISNIIKIEGCDLGKVAFLKELGRAAYVNPLRSGSWSEFFNREYKRRAERIALSEINEPNVAGVRDCPVCSLKSLIVYDDVTVEGVDSDELEMEGEETSEGTYERARRYTFMVKCINCTFEINHYLKNPSDYGLPIEDYWSSEQL